MELFNKALFQTMTKHKVPRVQGLVVMKERMAALTWGRTWLCANNEEKVVASHQLVFGVIQSKVFADSAILPLDGQGQVATKQFWSFQEFAASVSWYLRLILQHLIPEGKQKLENRDGGPVRSEGE